MIIKAIRTPAAAVDRLCNHLFRGDENEEVVVVRGTEADVGDFARDAKAYGARFAVRHFMVAPAEATTQAQALHVVGLLAAEFCFDEEACVVVEHAKPRADPSAYDRHWHVCVREVDPVSGRVLSSSYDRVRHEYVARLAETEFGQAYTKGAHHKAVCARFRREGHGDIADALDAAVLPDAERPREAFTLAVHQQAKRAGINLPDLRRVVRAAWQASANLAELQSALERVGLTMARGYKPGEWIITSDGVFVGSLQRLASVRKAEFIRKMENQDVQPTPGADHDSDGLDAARRDRREPDEAQQVRGVSDDADGAGRTEFHGKLDEPLGPTGRGDGRDAQKPSRPSQAPSGAGNRSGNRAGDQRRLTLPEIRQNIAALANRAEALGRSNDALAENYLETIEAEARAKIAHARTSAPSDADLEARRAEESAARCGNEALWRDVRKLDDEISTLKSMRGPSFKVWIRRPDLGRIEYLTEKRAEIYARIAASELRLHSAIAAVARAEKTFQTESIAAREASTAQIAEARQTLSYVAQARRVTQLWPALAFCAPRYIYGVGKQIDETRERRLRNPLAKDIWGVPIQP
jgi:hypothetical protein